jgi:hypothetical protein
MDDVVVKRGEVAIPKVRGAAFDGDTGLCPQRLVSSIGVVHHLCCCFIAINNIIFIIFVILVINPCLLLAQESCGRAFQTF